MASGNVFGSASYDIATFAEAPWYERSMRWAQIAFVENDPGQLDPDFWLSYFKTGKWAMADVMVIAIFMAYIGFTGIISEQLKQIEGLAQNIDILTTNKSSLLIGFFSFTSFVILSLLTSHKLQYKFNGELKENQAAEN